MTSLHLPPYARCICCGCVYTSPPLVSAQRNDNVTIAAWRTDMFGQPQFETNDKTDLTTTICSSTVQARNYSKWSNLSNDQRKQKIRLYLGPMAETIFASKKISQQHHRGLTSKYIYHIITSHHIEEADAGLNRPLYLRNKCSDKTLK